MKPEQSHRLLILFGQHMDALLLHNYVLGINNYILMQETTAEHHHTFEAFLLASLHWPPVKFRTEFKIPLTYKILNNQALSYLKDFLETCLTIFILFSVCWEHISHTFKNHGFYTMSFIQKSLSWPRGPNFNLLLTRPHSTPLQSFIRIHFKQNGTQTLPAARPPWMS